MRRRRTLPCRFSGCACADFWEHLATIGSTTPFVGLFGTVLGVMQAFQGMSKSGLNGDAMASGIAEALSATAFGLLVAVPSIVVYNYLVGRVQMMLLQIQAHVALLGPLYLRARTRRRRSPDAPLPCFRRRPDGGDQL